jgi:hypothetical protein
MLFTVSLILVPPHPTACFKFSTPFTKSGKAITETVTEQYKRNTLLYVPESYPAMCTAQRVSRRSETILTPIEAAAEDVDVRTDRMNEMLDSPHLSAKALTALLAGSVATRTFVRFFCCLFARLRCALFCSVVVCCVV